MEGFPKQKDLGSGEKYIQTEQGGLVQALWVEKIDRSKFDRELSNNFFLFFINNGNQDSRLEMPWFRKYYKTHGEEFDLLTERLTRARDVAYTKQKEYEESLGRPLEKMERGMVADEYLESEIAAVWEEMYEQYEAMYDSITNEDLQMRNRTYPNEILFR